VCLKGTDRVPDLLKLYHSTGLSTTASAMGAGHVGSQCAGKAQARWERRVCAAASWFEC
jgi:hypothetical protein